MKPNFVTAHWLILGGATAFNVVRERERTALRERLLTQARVVEVNVGKNLLAIDQSLAGRKGLTLDAGWRGPAAQRYRGDALRLRQMLSNFVANAIKFTERGGIRIVAAEADGDERGAQLRFAVIDTGIGIPPEQQEQLFKPFSQLDAANTRKYGGTGLGLSIVANLARLMDGDVGVDSDAGGGSAFWFRVRVERLAAGEECRSGERVRPATTGAEPT